MKVALPLLLLSTIVALALGKHDTTTDVDLHDLIKSTSGMSSDLINHLNKEIDDCIHVSHTHAMWYHCMDDHVHYYEDDHELSSKQASEIRKGAQNAKVHQKGGHHGHMLRGI